MANEEETVLCKWCDEPTSMLGTEECNRCWEVTTRLSTFLRSQKARDFVRQILLSREETIYFRYIRDPFATESKEKVEKQYKDYYERIRDQDQEPLSFDEWCDTVEYIPVKR